MTQGAQFSTDRLYRYALWRTWQEGEGHTMFIGLNPSTADETVDDPTIRRCIGFAHSMGYGGIYMLNLCAFRSTDPRGLKRVADPIGPDNLRYIEMYAKTAGKVIAAWGNHGWSRSRDTMRLIRSLGVEVWCFGRTKTGCPKHPLYLRADTELQPL